MRFVFRLLLWFLLASVFLYAVLWAYSRSVQSIDWGVSFSKEHSEWLGLDWQAAYRAILTDLQPQHVRVSALWNSVEKTEGMYDFSAIDFMMNEAKKHGAKVMVVVGQKEPRWPECHIPGWVEHKNSSERESALLRFEKAVVERYQSHPALELWQVENEPFITFAFGDCALYDADAIYKEIALVKSLDALHPVLVTDSGELGFWKKAAEAGDIFGTTLYRTVLLPSGRYWSYDWLPAGWYRMHAKLLGIPPERFFISELQAEPWVRASDPRTASASEMEYSLNIGRLEKNIDYAKRTGATRAYLWGAEWWYWMKTEKNDSRYWDAVKNVFEKAKDENKELKNLR